VRSGRFSAEKLGEQVLAVLTVRARDYVTAMTGGHASTDDVPERIRVTLANSGDKFLLKLKVF
jgi:hypothetical protein